MRAGKRPGRNGVVVPLPGFMFALIDMEFYWLRTGSHKCICKRRSCAIIEALRTAPQMKVWGFPLPSACEQQISLSVPKQKAPDKS